MQHSKVIFAVMVATCLFQVRGSPTGKLGGEPEVEDDSIVQGELSAGVNPRKITYHADGTVTGFGPGTYTINTVQEALASITIDSLSTALELDTSKKGVKKTTTIFDVFTQLLLGQSQNPQNGIINYETAIIFLNGFKKSAPDTVAALQTISYTMMKLKQQNSIPTNKDAYGFSQLAAKTFYGEENLPIGAQETWLDLAPFILEVLQGKADVAEKVVQFVVTQNATRRNNRTPKELPQEVIQETVEFANTIKQLIE